MNNSYFNDADLKLFFSYPKIKIVNSGFSELKPVIPDEEYLEWVNKNSSSHNHRELLIALMGNTYFTLNGLTYPCNPGSVFMIDSGDTHNFFYPPFFTDFNHIWCRIVRKVIYVNSFCGKQNGKTGSGKHLSFMIDECSSGLSVSRNWDYLTGAQYLSDEFKCLYMKNSIFGFILELCNKGFEKNAKPVEEETETHYRAVLQPILEHIKETGGKGLDIARLAYIAGYSKFHFARIFKQVTGVAVFEYINSARIEKYKELFKSGLSKKQISSELGFSCPAAFSRWEKDNLRL